MELSVKSVKDRCTPMVVIGDVLRDLLIEYKQNFHIKLVLLIFIYLIIRKIFKVFQ